MNAPAKVPPIKTQGIKTKLVEWIKGTVRWDANGGRWIEPFMGSGVVGFNMLPKNAIFADSNPHIIRFYNDLNTGYITPYTIRLYLESEGEKLSRFGVEHYYSVRDRFNRDNDSLDFLFLNRSCFNGLIRFNKKGAFNVPFGHKPQRFSKSYITKIVNQADFVHRAMQSNEWSFICQDFEKTLKGVSENDFVYCDPPYIGRHVNYYDSWDEKLENKLFRALNTIPSNFILSTWHSNQYRKNHFIDSVWSSFDVITREHFYHVGAREVNRTPMIEALVFNSSVKKP